MYKGLSRRYTKLEQHILTVSVKLIELTEGHEVKGFGEVFLQRIGSFRPRHDLL